jgi:hypothetical protein
MESIVVVKRWYYITCPRTESLMHESMQTCYSEMGVNMCEHMVSTWHLSWLKINVVTLHGRQAIWKLSASYYSWRGRASWYIMKYHDIIEIYIHVCVYTHVCICMYVCLCVYVYIYNDRNFMDSKMKHHACHGHGTLEGSRSNGRCRPRSYLAGWQTLMIEGIRMKNYGGNMWKLGFWMALNGSHGYFRCFWMEVLMAILVHSG